MDDVDDVLRPILSDHAFDAAIGTGLLLMPAICPVLRELAVAFQLLVHYWPCGIRGEARPCPRMTAAPTEQAIQTPNPRAPTVRLGKAL